MISTLQQDRTLVHDLAQNLGVTPENIKSRSRTDNYYFAKCTIFWLLRYKAEWTFQRIGDATGRDHSTIINNLRVFEGLVEVEKKSEREFVKRAKVLLPFFIDESAQ